MKKQLIGLLLLGSLAAFVKTATAATAADLLITVTPNGSKSVTLSTGTLALGTLTLPSVDNLTSSVTVTNNGSTTETLRLRVKTNDDTWSAGAAAGANTYNLRALFNSAAPVAGDFAANDDVLFAGAVSATGAGGVYSGDQDGSVFDAATSYGLWFKLDMPTTSTIATERSFTVEVSVN